MRDLCQPCPPPGGLAIFPNLPMVLPVPSCSLVFSGICTGDIVVYMSALLKGLVLPRGCSLVVRHLSEVLCSDKVQVPVVAFSVLGCSDCSSCLPICLYNSKVDSIQSKCILCRGYALHELELSGVTAVISLQKPCTIFQ
jgi:hypothetical protein